MRARATTSSTAAQSFSWTQLSIDPLVQQRPVDLARAASRQRRLADVDRGNHVLRQLAGDLAAHDCGIQVLVRLVEERDLLRLEVVDHAPIRHELERVDDDVLDLRQLNPVSGMLDQRILAALEDDFAARVVVDDVARAVDQFGIGRVERILRERRRRLLGIVVVAHRERGAADAEFALLLSLHELVVSIEHEDVRVLAGEADRNRLLVRDVARNLEPGAVQRDLDRTIEIHEARPRRQLAVPHVELLGREDLAGVPDHLQVGQRELVEQPHVRDVDHDGRDPEDERDMLTLEQFEDLHREHRPRVGNQHQRGAIHVEHAELEAVDVEDDWRQRTDHLMPFEIPRLLRAVQEVEEAPVVEHDALRRSRRTRRVDQAERVGVDQMLQTRVEIGLALRQRGELLQRHDADDSLGRLRDVLLVRLVRDHQQRLRGPEHVRQTLWRRLDVHVHVGVARVDDGRVRDDRLGALGQEDRDRTAPRPRNQGHHALRKTRLCVMKLSER